MESVAVEDADPAAAVFVTPLLPGEAVLELLGGTPATENAQEAAAFQQATKLDILVNGILNCFDDIHVASMSSAEQWLHSIEEINGRYAEGTTDAESIRDQLSGTGKQPYSRRDPYFHCPSKCSEHEGLYRRRIKPRIDIDGDLF